MSNLWPRPIFGTEVSKSFSEVAHNSNAPCFCEMKRHGAAWGQKLLSISLDFYKVALPLKGSNPAHQPADRASTRHLQVGLEVHRKSMFRRVHCFHIHTSIRSDVSTPQWYASFFFYMLEYVGVSSQQKSDRHDCRTVKWLAGRSFVNGKSWRPGRAFNSSGSVIGGRRTVMLACLLQAGWISRCWAKVDTCCILN